MTKDTNENWEKKLILFLFYVIATYIYIYNSFSVNNSILFYSSHENVNSCHSLTFCFLRYKKYLILKALYFTHILLIS